MLRTNLHARLGGARACDGRVRGIGRRPRPCARGARAPGRSRRPRDARVVGRFRLTGRVPPRSCVAAYFPGTASKTTSGASRGAPRTGSPEDPEPLRRDRPGPSYPPGRGRYDSPVRPAVVIALVVVGLSGVVYGAASLTGGWLGTPPWWEREVSTEEYIEHRWGVVLASPSPLISPDRTLSIEREGRGVTSGAVIAVGLALAALGAWPLRRRPTATT